MTRYNEIGWSDEFRIGLYGSTRRVLAPRGVKVRQRVQIVREWRYLALVVVPRAGRLMWAWLPRVRGEDVAVVVRAWHERGIDALVWDGHGSHSEGMMAATGMVVVPQPAAAPELNPAERIGEVIRARVEGEVYPTIEEKVAAVEKVLDELAADPERVRRLVGWHWILAAQRRLPLTPRKRWPQQRG